MSNTVLDANSYHVFKFMNEAILYDLSTDSIIKIDDDFTFSLLKLAGQYDIVNLRQQLEKNYGYVDEQKIMNVISPLKESGFFVSPPADWRKIKETKKKLMSDHPDHIQLSIAQGCNLACVYCYAEASGSNSRNQLMSFDVAKQSVDYLVYISGSRKKLSIQFFGGEPLMNFELIKQVVDYTKALSAKTDKTFRFHISTNCTLLTEEVQNYLVENRFGVFVLTLQPCICYIIKKYSPIFQVF